MENNSSFEKEIRSAEAYIDEQFSNAQTNNLKKEIMEEVKSFITRTITSELEQLKVEQNSRFGQYSFPEKGENEYLNHLKKEIDFLRKQIENKDDLIYSLVNENSELSHQNKKKDTPCDIFLHPKNPVKAIKRDQIEKNPITFNNRYDGLLIEENTNEQNNDIFTPLQNDNVTKRKSRGNKTQNRNDNVNKQVVAVIGDSMIKHVKGYKLSNKDKKVVVKTFPGAKTNCMQHYLKPTLEQKPDMLILHCGTNDLKSKEPEEITDNIIKLATSVSNESENTIVVVSGIVPRGDNLNTKVVEVNEILKRKCDECNIGYIDNSNIDPREHLNKSRLHLNINGTNELEKNLQNMINC